MPLINLQTDLKSLKFGGDRRGGGDSQQPFIRVPIPPQNSDTINPVPQSIGSGVFGLGEGPLLETLSDLASGGIGQATGLGNNDILIRGGASSITRSAIDATRITRFLSTPEGLLFIAKQNQLSNSGVRTQGSRLINDLGYLPLSTIGQAVGNAFGLHLLKQGTRILEGTKNDPKPNRYLDNVDPLRNNELTTSTNRLVALKEAIDTNTSTKIRNIRLNNNGNILDYSGGPDTFGLGGRTNIRFADPNQRTGQNNPFLLNTGFYGNTTPISGISFDLGSVATGASTFVQSGLSGLSNRGGFVGFVGNALSSFVPSLLNTGVGKLEEFVQSSINSALGFENLPPQSNFYVFRRPTPNFNFTNYVRLSNIFGSIVSDPNTFNDEKNAIRTNGDRGTTFDFNIYQGNGDISQTNPELQNKNFGATWTQKNILEASLSPGRTAQDFRKKIIEERGENDVITVISNSPNYRTQNRENRVDTGDPGRGVADNVEGVFNYGVPANILRSVDRMNALQAYDVSAGGLPDYSKPVRDLVKLRFAILNFNGTKTYLHFRSHINSFSDSYNGNWNSVRYAGRADNFYNYEGFDRQINFSFTVAAMSKAELIPMYKKLNQLAATLAPEYSDAGFMKGNLINFTMGGYIYETPGFLNSLNYTIPQESPFEIAIDTEGNTDDSVKELPLLINVDAQFTPVHNFLVEKANSNTNPNAKYISLQNDVNNNYGDGYTEPIKYQALSEGLSDILPSTVNPNVDELLSRAQNQLSNTTSNILANSTGRLIPRPVEGFGLPNPVRNTNSPNFDPVDGTSLTGGDTQITL